MLKSSPVPHLRLQHMPIGGTRELCYTCMAVCTVGSSELEDLLNARSQALTIPAMLLHIVLSLYH